MNEQSVGGGFGSTDLRTRSIGLYPRTKKIAVSTAYKSSHGAHQKLKLCDEYDLKKEGEEGT